MMEKKKLEELKRESYELGYRAGMAKGLLKASEAISEADQLFMRDDCSCSIGKKHSCPVHGSGVQ